MSSHISNGPLNNELIREMSNNKTYGASLLFMGALLPEETKQRFLILPPPLPPHRFRHVDKNAAK